MFSLAWKELYRRPVHHLVALAGMSAAVAALACLSMLGEGYRRNLANELDHMGLQLMLVPLGCPYDAAARVLKGRALETSLPAEALDAARRDPAVAVAAPLLIASVPQPDRGRVDLWVGLNEAALALKPWWRAASGSPWFPDAQSVILGSEAAEVEMRVTDDALFSPETDRALRVTGVLERSGTSDDSLFFVPLATAQQMFHSPGRLTAVAIRLKDPTLLAEAARRLQETPGAQVATLSEMMGTFLNLLGAVRTLLQAVAIIAVVVGGLGVFNTLTAAVSRRTGELGVMRAVGASRRQVFALIAIEGLQLAGASCLAGLALAAGGGRLIEQTVKHLLPLAPSGSLLSFSVSATWPCCVVALGAGLVAGLHPAWRASRLQPGRALCSL